MSRRLMSPLVAAVLLAAVLVLPASAAPPADTPAGRQALLREYAEATWRSFSEGMLFEETGLPADNVSVDGERSRYTSPTNIGAYLWSTLVARDLQLITPREARQRIDATLDTVETLERHEESGQFFNWYDPATGEVVEIWPVDGNPVHQFLSSVDNGWLAAALWMVSNAVPQERERAWGLVESMDFGFYYNPDEGQIRGGYWTEDPPGVVVGDVSSTDCRPAAEIEGEGGFTCHHYGAFNTEPRIASYIGIAMGDIPPEHYFRTFRTFPPTCDWSWVEQQPGGEWHTYLGIDVFEGHHTYAGLQFVPSWGGSMFEALMVPLLVPEEDWGAQSWAINHPLYVEGQIYHGLEEAGYGYWGFSPSNNPAGGYREYGVDQMGLEPNGYASDQERTYVTGEWTLEDCPQEEVLPDEYGQGVVTPHASFLALDFKPDEAIANLENLRNDFDVWTEWGFVDAVNVATGEISPYFLALDQGMIMAALGNELRNDQLQSYLADKRFERALRPLMEMEQFTAGRLE